VLATVDTPSLQQALCHKVGKLVEAYVVLAIEYNRRFACGFMWHLVSWMSTERLINEMLQPSRVAGVSFRKSWRRILLQIPAPDVRKRDQRFQKAGKGIIKWHECL
jgi:hypothetical protein